VTLSWKAPQAPKNCSLGNYTVLKNGTSVATTGDTSYVATGLSPSTAYGFTVKASDLFGQSAASAALQVTTLAGSGGSSCSPAWSTGAVYLAGAAVSAAGVNYKANWWTQGDDPTAHNGAAGSGMPWTAVGACAPCSIAPTAPTGLTAFGITSTSASLLWQASVVPLNCKVTGYNLFKNGAQVATTAGTSITVPKLTASTTYSFAVAGVDPIGSSAKSAAVSLTTLATSAGGAAQTVFAPYIDMSLTAAQDLVAIQKASGIRVFTLAFVLSPGGCAAGWGGIGSIQQDILDNGTSLLAEVQGLRTAGGDVIISFGGANGQEPALTCPDAASLKAVYQQVVDRYQAKSLDFDIEGGAVADQASIARRNKALVALKAANPGLKISYTLPVLPTGLDSNGVAVLQSAKRDGLDPDLVNVMAMDYGTAVDNGGQMGLDATAAAANTAVQIHQAGLTSMVGVIPMIGQNDNAAEVFTLADAQTLLDFARQNGYVTRLSLWSVGRDNGSCAGVRYASPSCSSLTQSAYQFSKVFEGFYTGF
jgi:chitodextrinase